MQSSTQSGGISVTNIHGTLIEEAGNCAGGRLENPMVGGWISAFCKGTLSAAVFLSLGACAVPVTDTSATQQNYMEELPEQVVAIAASYQNLQAVRLRPDDGCYWYRHVGPVETTMLPLLTASGRSICTRREADLPAAN